MIKGHPLKEMSLLEHLRELRKRLVYSCIAIVVGTFVAYAYAENIFHLLTSIFYENFHGGILIGTGPAEAFLLKLQVSLFAGIIIVSPVLFFQAWKFVEPGLYPREKRYAAPFIACATSLFLFGIWFCYSTVLPFALGFFADQYKSIDVTPQVRISEHLSILMQALIGFGAVFELPVMAFFLARFGILDHKTMLGAWRYIVVAIFVLSAFLAPPDVFSQLLMVSVLLLLYLVSTLVVRLTEVRTSSAPAGESVKISPEKSANPPPS